MIGSNEFDIPFIRPTFPPSSLIAEDIDQVVKTNWYTNFGPAERAFTREIEGYLGKDIHVSTFANGTLALIAGINSAIGFGSDDTFLLMPSFTFIAVPQAAQWNRYRPWFIDIDPHTWQTSPDAAREILEDHRDHIAGIVLPNALGVGSPHIDEWERLSQEWDLPIVIDSAAGFGSKYADSTPLGSRGSCEIFSFHSTKPFGIGEGGALVSLSRPLIETTHDFQNFGFNESKICYTLGLNGKMSEIAASIGRRQLEDFDSRLNDRGETFKIYREALSDAGMSFQPNAENSSHFCASICAETHEQKLNIRESLTAHRVQSRDYYNPPLHLHDYFRLNPTQAKVGTLKATEQVCSRIISLPIHDQMDPENRDRVISAVLKGLDS